MATPRDKILLKMIGRILRRVNALMAELIHVPIEKLRDVSTMCDVF